MGKRIYALFLIAFYSLQFGSELLLSSDIPVQITSLQLGYFAGFTLLSLFLFLQFSPNTSSKTAWVVTLIFTLVWFMSLINVFKLFSPPVNLIIMNSLALLTPVTLLLTFWLKHGKE
ncbi:hypothetical protein [Paenibacillus physcomitrellae]|nr:hypothetical protein [Paenibacillus physcomitrellae]